MNTTTANPCQLLCASAAAYAIAATDPSGVYNPTMMEVNGQWVPDPSKSAFLNQYNNVGFTADPHVITSAEIDAALVGPVEGAIIIAFRGTLSPKEKENNLPVIVDWLNDFLMFTESNIDLPGEVHFGFLSTVMALHEDIANAVKAIDPTGTVPVFVTGHSKGGGVAPIAAMYLKNVYKMNIAQTITFAGPNAGNADFATAYNAAFPNHLRYENYLDIIPLLPPSPLFVTILEENVTLPPNFTKLLNDVSKCDYTAVGDLMYINSSGNVDKYTSSITINALLLVRMKEIGDALKNNLSAVLSAHHSSCGYGYMNGTCPLSVCAV